MSESSSRASFLRHYRQRRATRPRRRGRSWVVAGILFAAAATGATAALVERGSDSWRPPSGAPRFVACTYDGRLDAWCGRVSVPTPAVRTRGSSAASRALPIAAAALVFVAGWQLVVTVANYPQFVLPTPGAVLTRLVQAWAQVPPSNG